MGVGMNPTIREDGAQSGESVWPNHRGDTFLQALFTATSATCVTGLNILDPRSTFNRLGEVIILILIQVGGLGINTFGTLFASLRGQHTGGTTNSESPAGPGRISERCPSGSGVQHSLLCACTLPSNRAQRAP